MTDRTIREMFREGVIATLLLDQQSAHKPTNEHFAERITLLFDYYVSELKQPEKQEIDVSHEVTADMADFNDVVYNRDCIIELQKAVNKLLEK